MWRIFILLIPCVCFADPFGVVNPNVTQENIRQTICVPYWTDTVRPSSSYTDNLKAEQLGSNSNLKAFEEDHILPLSLGGHPTDKRNLVPQPWDGKCGAHKKDIEESHYHREVCKGKLTLAEAQKHFMPWVCR